MAAKITRNTMFKTPEDGGKAAVPGWMQRTLQLVERTPPEGTRSGRFANESMAKFYEPYTRVRNLESRRAATENMAVHLAKAGKTTEAKQALERARR